MPLFDLPISITSTLLVPPIVAVIAGYWLAARSARFALSHAGKRWIGIWVGVGVYLAVFGFLHFLLRQVLIGAIASGSNAEGAGLMIWFVGVKFLPLILLTWLVGLILIFRKTRRISMIERPISRVVLSLIVLAALVITCFALIFTLLFFS